MNADEAATNVVETVLPQGPTYFKIKKDLAQRQLVTVCQEAKCPNIGECWNTGTATFMVLGDTCTRACRFCHIKTGNPQGVVDVAEPQRVADSVRVMGLNYAVITMVDRDDLPDGGAAHLAAVVRQVRVVRPQIKVELLTSDFRGELSSLETLFVAAPEVLAHNVETVERLTRGCVTAVLPTARRCGCCVTLSAAALTCAARVP